MYPYRFATRLNSFLIRPVSEGSLSAAIATVAAVPGLSALELNYPEHIVGQDLVAVRTMVTEYGLALTAINLRYPQDKFRLGAFTNPDQTVCRSAIELTRQAAFAAFQLEAGHLVLWLGPDGSDYPLQVNFAQLWRDEIAGIAEIAAEFPNLRVSIEYKGTEPRRMSVIRNMGEALLAAESTGLANVGVTLDLCHSQMTREYPPFAAALALERGRLFGLHLNDGYGLADDGLMVGSVQPWSLLDLLVVLRQRDYQGVIYFDTFPETVNPSEECQRNIENLTALDRFLTDDRMAAIADGQRRHHGLLLGQLMGELFHAADR